MLSAMTTASVGSTPKHSSHEQAESAIKIQRWFRKRRALKRLKERLGPIVQGFRVRKALRFMRNQPNFALVFLGVANSS